MASIVISTPGTLKSTDRGCFEVPRSLVISPKYGLNTWHDNYLHSVLILTTLLQCLLGHIRLPLLDKIILSWSCLDLGLPTLSQWDWWLVLRRYIHYWAGHKYGGSRGLRTEEGISQLLLSVMTIRAPILTSPAPTAPPSSHPPRQLLGSG